MKKEWTESILEREKERKIQQVEKPKKRDNLHQEVKRGGEGKRGTHVEIEQTNVNKTSSS